MSCVDWWQMTMQIYNPFGHAWVYGAGVLERDSTIFVILFNRWSFTITHQKVKIKSIVIFYYKSNISIPLGLLACDFQPFPLQSEEWYNIFHFKYSNTSSIINVISFGCQYLFCIFLYVICRKIILQKLRTIYKHTKHKFVLNSKHTHTKKKKKMKKPIYIATIERTIYNKVEQYFRCYIHLNVWDLSMHVPQKLKEKCPQT